MNHIYQNIGGWFNFQDIYSEMVEKVVDRAHFVEIGTCMGKSASFMGVEILNSGKNITFDTIDTFEGSPTEIDGKHSFFKERDVEAMARRKLSLLPVNVIKGYSTEVAKTYKFGSLDFVFIDGSHIYKDVADDIKSWLPKIKKGGFIGGHDYNNGDVFRAVNDILKKDCPKSMTSWMLQI